MNTRVETQNRVDQLIHHFWKNGYLTLSRRYGKYLPEPKPIGDYQVDAVGRYKKKVVLGVILKEDELNDPKLISKLTYLTEMRGKNKQTKLTLFAGVPSHLTNKARIIIKSLNSEVQNRIKIIKLNTES